MRNSFTLPHFPDSTLEIETSIWTGRPSLWKDGVELERSSEEGKPFLTESDSGEVYKIYPKQSFTDVTGIHRRRSGWRYWRCSDIT